MKQKIAHIALVVRDYDEAIAFYTQKLDFVLLEDTRLNDQKRWAIVSPPGTNGCSLLLGKAAPEMEQLDMISIHLEVKSHCWSHKF